jgi:hypothetical protein
VIILNSGVIHRVGGCRVSVKLAKRLAGLGYVAARFDHAGIGDSPPRRDGLDLEESHKAEIIEVMTALEHRAGSGSFVLYGLCSGARDGFYAALQDHRVVGIVQVDGFAYRNFKYHLIRGLHRLRGLRMLNRPLRRRMGSLPRRELSTPGKDMWVEAWPDYPPRREVRHGYERLVKRGVHIYAVYTGSWHLEFNYEGQFLDMYSGVDFGDLLTVRYLPDASHLLPKPEHQEAVLAGVTEWIIGTFAPDSEISV